MGKLGIEWHVTTELTDAQVLADNRFKFPCAFSVDLAPNIVKKIQYDRNGVKSSVVYAGEIKDSFQIGAVTTTPTKVNIALHPSGENFAIISGVKYSKTVAQEFTYTAITPGKLKSLILYAKPNSTIFYLAEGVEGLQAVAPPYTGLFIASIIVSQNGSSITELSIFHNTLQGLQGGNAFDEYYHLSKSKYDNLNTFILDARTGVEIKANILNQTDFDGIGTKLPQLYFIKEL